MNNVNNILYKEAQLDDLINRLVSKTSQINARFDSIKQQTSITDGVDCTWKSKAQQAFKEKKDKYVKQFEIVSEELKIQIELLKKAKNDMKNAEAKIQNNVEQNIANLQ